jgi:serine/threonine-protein kinase
MAQIKRRSAYSEEYVSREDSMRLRSDTEAMYENDEEMEDEADYDYDPKMERITTILAVVAGIIILIIIIILAVKLLGGNGSGSGDGPILSEESSGEADTVVMPDVTGMNLEDAKNTLSGLGLLTSVEYEESDTIDEGVVIRTDVEIGDDVEQGSTVTLVVSAGTQGVEVWEVTGYTYEEANNKLSSLGFLVNKAEAYSDTVDSGLVITQSPVGGSKAPKGSVITVTVSLGKEDKKIRVPNLVGLTEQDGTIEAIEAGLQIGNVSYVYSSEVAEGYICYQSYSHGSYVDAGTALDIKVSQGKESITYKCNASITAPTTSEAPDYVSGTEVSIKLVTDDGKVLLDTKTSTFPQAANYYGLTSSGGTLTMTYKVTTAGSTTIDSDTGETISTPGTSEEKSFTRRIEFVQE